MLRLDEEDGRIVTKRMGPNMLIPMARVLSKRHAPKARLDKLLNAIDLADIRKSERDMVAHGSWTTLKPDNVPMAMSIKLEGPPGTIGSETFSEDRMRTIIRDLTAVRDFLFLVRGEIAKAREESEKPPRKD